MSLDDTFALIVSAALNGARCPRGHPHGPLNPNHVSRLIREGRIRVQNYGRNWRVATVLEGPHAGKSTLASPYLNGPVSEARPRPSAPRDYSRGG